MSTGRSLFSKIMIGFGFVMVAVFIGIGMILLFFPVYNYLPRNIKSILGVFFIAYGLFRFARIYQQIRLKKRKEYYDE